LSRAHHDQLTTINTEAPRIIVIIIIIINDSI